MKQKFTITEGVYPIYISIIELASFYKEPAYPLYFCLLFIKLGIPVYAPLNYKGKENTVPLSQLYVKADISLFLTSSLNEILRKSIPLSEVIEKIEIEYLNKKATIEEFKTSLEAIGLDLSILIRDLNVNEKSFIILGKQQSSLRIDYDFTVVKKQTINDFFNNRDNLASCCLTPEYIQVLTNNIII